MVNRHSGVIVRPRFQWEGNILARTKTTSMAQKSRSELNNGVPTGKPMQRHGSLYDPEFPEGVQLWDHEKESIICDAIRKGANLAAACRLAFPFDSNKSYMRVRNRFKIDPVFKAAVEQAQAEYDSLLTSEATRRAIEGVLEPVFFQGQRQYEDINGRVVQVTKRVYSDKILETLLKLRVPGPTKQVSVTGKIRHDHAVNNHGDNGDSNFMQITPDDVMRLPEDQRTFLLDILRGIAQRRGETDLEALDELKAMPPLLESHAVEDGQYTENQQADEIDLDDIEI